MKKTLINFVIEEDLLERIEDFRFKNRFATRASAIKWLLNSALKQKPSVRPPKEEVSEAPAPPEPVELPVVSPPAAAPPSMAALPLEPEPTAPLSRLSVTQALRDQGYEVGEDSAHHADGHERILVRSHTGSAWVNVIQELQDLAAARVTLTAIAARRASGK